MLFVYNTNIRCCLFDLRDRQTDRNMYVREKRWPVTSCVHPDWGPNPQFRCGPWLGIEPATFWCTGQRPNNWASWPGCGVCLFFLIYWFQRKRKGGGGVWGEWERERNIYLLFHLLMRSLGDCCVWPHRGSNSQPRHNLGMSAALVYLDSALTNWATWPRWIFLSYSIVIFLFGIQSPN